MKDLYQQGLQYFVNREFYKAKQIFDQIDYEDSKLYARVCEKELSKVDNQNKLYQDAMELYFKERYNEALNIFETLGDYKQSKVMASLCRGAIDNASTIKNLKVEENKNQEYNLSDADEMFENGEYEKAYEVYIKLKDQLDEYSAYEIAENFENECMEDEAIEFYELAGDLGDSMGYFCAAELYFTNEEYDKALELYEKEYDITKSYLTAKKIGDVYFEYEDFPNALYWYDLGIAFYEKTTYTKFADDIERACEVAMIYYFGRNVEQDDEKAKRWAKLASDLGNEEAKKLLDILE